MCNAKHILCIIPDYVNELTKFLCTDVTRDAEPYRQAWAAVAIPAHLSATYTRPNKEEAVSSHVTRSSRVSEQSLD